jgi:hypothetical protein
MSTRLPRRVWLLALLAAGCAGAATADAMVEVWVELTEPVPATADNPDDAAARRKRVDRQQDEVAIELRKLGAIEFARIRHTSNAIGVRIAADRLDAVRRIPGVKRVRTTKELHPPVPHDLPRNEPR